MSEEEKKTPKEQPQKSDKPEQKTPSPPPSQGSSPPESPGQVQPPPSMTPPKTGQFPPPPTGAAPPPPPGQQGPPQQPQQPGQARPPGQHPPPPQQRQFDVGNVTAQAQKVVNAIRLDLNITVKVLIVSFLSGILAALLDQILGVPTPLLVFNFGWMIMALNGPLYSFFKGKDDIAGLVMSAVAGLLAFTVWFLVLEMIGSDDYSPSDSSTQDGFKVWFNQLNILKTGLAGILMGMLSYGWFVLMRRLPEKIIPMKD
jgi:hypothetical protein